MNPANATSGSGTATMSRSEPSKDNPEDQAPSPSTPSNVLTEAQYLQQQQAAALSALTGALKDMTRGLGQTADPRRWMQTHPWMTLVSAAVAGFAAAAVAVPSKEQQALKKLEAIERALYSHRNGHQGPEEKRPSDGDGAKKSGGFLATILHELLGAAKPLIMTLLSSHMGGAQVPQTETVDAADRGTPNYPV